LTLRNQKLANPDRGTKREDPDTGKKFYDLNKDPIVSPYTGKSYPRSFFEQGLKTRSPVERDEEEEEEAAVEEVAGSGPQIVSLEEADAEEAGEDEIPEVADVEDVEDIGEDDADVFLEEDEDEEDDLDFDVGGGGGDER
jgi:uncharacterized protein (TIGR02300 family)